MRTPNKYLEFYRNNIPDKDMLADVIYAFNKRAKNARDKYKITEKELFYKKKEALLKLYFHDNIKCIHRQCIRNKRHRIYDYEPEYKNVEFEDIIWKNCYFDYNICEYVWFVDIVKDTYIYFIYIECDNGKSFHTPINSIYKKYKNLPINDLPDDFITDGLDERKILSKDFCEKVFNKFVISKYPKNSWKNLKL